MKIELIIVFVILLLILMYYCNENDEIYMEHYVPFNALSSYKDKKDLINLFRKFSSFMHDNKIEYWIIGGTLLGAIRDNGLIAWDDDVDISVMKKYVDKIIKCRKELADQGMGLTEWFGGWKVYDLNGRDIPNHDFKFPFIDIFTTIMDETNRGLIYENAYARELWPLEFHLYNDIFPLKKYNYEDFTVYGPKDGIKFIDKIYPNWRTSAIKTYDHTTHSDVNMNKFSIDYDNTQKPYLWLYWDNINNNNTPAIIDLCYDTVVHNCSKSFRIVRLNNKNINTYLPEIKSMSEYFNKLIIAHKVDIYRIMLLYKYGGIYLDSDIVVLTDLSDIINKLKKYDFVGFGCTGDICKNGYGHPSNWLLASRPNTNLMANILQQQINIIKNQNMNIKKLDYHDLGKELIKTELQKLIENQNYEYFHYPNTVDGTRDVYGHWVTSQRLFSNDPIIYDNENDMMICVYYNSSHITNFINKLSREEILNKKWNITKFIKRGLGYKSYSKPYTYFLSCLHLFAYNKV
jgi:phosphorylcholine metabolism protein LicD